MSDRKAGSVGLCCALLVMLTCAASTTAPATTASPGALALSAANYSVAPSKGAVIVTVQRVSGSKGIAVAGYRTFDGSAAAGVDSTATFGTLTCADGDTTPRTITVPIAAGRAGARSLTVALLSASGASFGTPIAAIVSISAATARGAPSIQVQGNQLVRTLDGNAVQIVGTNISGLETGVNDRWASFSNAGTAFWSQVLNWGGSGINTVRLPLNEASWLNYTCYDPGAGVSGSVYPAASGGGYQPDPNNVYQAIVEKAVADATAAGLYVILDLHWASPNNAAGQPLCPIGQPGFADADHSLAFWKSVADTFKDNPAVLFELFNEPFDTNTYSDWVVEASDPGPDAFTLRDGGAYYPFDEQNNTNGVIESTAMSWQVAGMQDMINVIRGEGATNVILSSPIGWAGEIETWLVSRPTDPIGQLAGAWHVYGYRKGHAAPLAVLAAGYPIVITETFGLGNIGGYGWAASQGIGYTWWGWNDWGGQALSAELATPPRFESTAP